MTIVDIFYKKDGGSMFKITCSCYRSESQKILEILNQKKDEGYIVSKIEFEEGIGRLFFEECSSDFVYSLDYSNLYPKKKIYFDENNERFDNFKLSGWKLICMDNGIGIWIHDHNEDIVPFFSDDEYQKLEKEEYKGIIKQIKSLSFITISFIILALINYMKRGDVSILFGIPSLLFYIYSMFQVLYYKKKYAYFIFRMMNIYIVGSMYLFDYLPLLWIIGMELLEIITCLDFIRKDSFILKNDICMWIIIMIWSLMMTRHLLFV